MFPEDKMWKCLFYARSVCLMDDGVVYRFIWEVKTDRRDSVGSSTDQWISRERSCRIVALLVNARSISDVDNSDEFQVAWDEALEIPPNFAAPVAKPKAKALQPESKARPTPPPGAKEKKPVTTSSPDAPKVSTPGSGAIPEPDSGDIGAIPMSTDETDWLQIEKPDDLYQALLTTLSSDGNAKEVAEETIHNSSSWILVWKEVTKDVAKEEKQILMRRLKMVIWHQTVMTIGQNRKHMVLHGLSPLANHLTVTVSDLSYHDASTIMKKASDRYTVLNIDCLEVVEMMSGHDFQSVGVLNMASRTRPGGGVASGKGA